VERILLFFLPEPSDSLVRVFQVTSIILGIISVIGVAAGIALVSTGETVVRDYFERKLLWQALKKHLDLLSRGKHTTILNDFFRTHYLYSFLSDL